jgi:hypothetical protein
MFLKNSENFQNNNSNFSQQKNLPTFREGRFKIPKIITHDETTGTQEICIDFMR